MPFPTSPAPHPSFHWPPLLGEVAATLAALGADLERVWAVGGVVRDGLLGRPVHDLDLAVQRDAIALARALADRLQAAFYPLDSERGCARVVLARGDDRYEIDLTDLRAPSLADDLAARDFTLNAMAVSLASPELLIDPLGGLPDLLARRLRAPSAAALRDDPLRGVRGVRLAAELGGTLEANTRDWIRSAARELAQVAAERRGAELWKCFAAPDTATALRQLAALGLLPALVPEATAAIGCEQGPQHALDLWEHTLATVAAVERLRALVAGAPAHGPFEPRLVPRLDRLRSALGDHLDEELAVGHPRGPWLEAAAFFHDLGKPRVRTQRPPAAHAAGGDPGGAPVVPAFPGHAECGAQLARDRLRALRFSAEEMAWVSLVVRHHGAIGRLDQTAPLGARTLHRLLRNTGRGAPGIALLSLADLLAHWFSAEAITAGATPAGPTEADRREAAIEAWRQRVERAGELLEAFFLHRSELLPAPLLDGDQLIALGAPQGPAVGRTLAALAEAQAAGEVTDTTAARAFVLAALDGPRTMPPVKPPGD
jgi:tRNA nucleotidyltransferase/poly(A) polymerase